MNHNLFEQDLEIQCDKHQNEKIQHLNITDNQNIQLNQRTLCAACIDQLNKKDFIETKQLKPALTQYKNIKTAYQKQITEKISESETKLLPLKFYLLEIKKNINSTLENALKQIDSIQNLIEEDYGNYIIDEHTTCSLEILRKIGEILSYPENKEYCNLDRHYARIFTSLKQTCQDFQLFSKQVKESLKIFTIEKMNFVETNQKQKSQNCCAVAFNMNGTLFANAENDNIKIWRNLNQKLSSLDYLKGHSQKIQCLVFGNKSDILVSGGYDKSIIIWQKNKSNNFQKQQQLNFEVGYVQSIVICNDDKEILVSQGQLIRVLQFENEWQERDPLNKHENNVYQLSLSQDQNCLASCSYDKTIIVWKRQEKLWVVDATIKTQDYGYNVCLINEQLIAFQQNGCRYLQFYKFYKKEKDTDKREFELDKFKIELPMLNTGSDCSFPMTFNHTKQILFLRHNNIAVIFRKRKDNKIYKEQEFEVKEVMAAIDQSGEQMMLWNQEEQKISLYLNQPETIDDQSFNNMKKKIKELINTSGQISTILRKSKDQVQQTNESWPLLSQVQQGISPLNASMRQSQPEDQKKQEMQPRYFNEPQTNQIQIKSKSNSENILKQQQMETKQIENNNFNANSQINQSKKDLYELKQGNQNDDNDDLNNQFSDQQPFIGKDSQQSDFQEKKESNQSEQIVKSFKDPQIIQFDDQLDD